MERQEMLDGLQISPDQVPKFQAYLRQQLVFEHQRLRLQRSQRRWMVTAMAATAVIVFGLARPGVTVKAHNALFPTKEMTSLESYALSGGPAATRGAQDRTSRFARSLEANLERDRTLASELGWLKTVSGEPLPENTLVVNRFPLSGGREMEIYTSVPLGRVDETANLSFASNGGVW